MAGPTFTTADPERDEIEALLPWYVAGTLSSGDHARVERYIAAHPEFERLVEIAREECVETIAGNESVGAPSPLALDRLMGRISTEARPVERRSRQASLFERLGERLGEFVQSLAPPQLAMATAAVLALLVVQGVTIGTMLGTRGGDGYVTASGGKDASAEAGTFALVAFAPTATAAKIGEFLSELGGTIVDGPKAGGIYRVRLSAETLDEAAAKAQLARFTARGDLVTFAALTR